MARGHGFGPCCAFHRAQIALARIDTNDVADRNDKHSKEAVDAFR